MIDSVINEFVISCIQNGLQMIELKYVKYLRRFNEHRRFNQIKNGVKMLKIIHWIIRREKQGTDEEHFVLSTYKLTLNDLMNEINRRQLSIAKLEQMQIKQLNQWCQKFNATVGIQCYIQCFVYIFGRH